MTPPSPSDLRPSSGPDSRGTSPPRDAPDALVNRSVMDLMAHPSLGAERVSQAVVGESARILASHAEWVELRLERDGYSGWAQREALHEASVSDFAAARAAGVLVSAEIATAFSSFERAEAVGKLPFGVQLPQLDSREGSVAVRLPDGRTWWLARQDTLAAPQRPSPDAPGIALGLSLLRRSVGVPYLWGGCTPFGYDCSGLTQAFAAWLGVRIPRDADQQFRAESLQAVPAPPTEGDLLFFSTAKGSAERPRHADVGHVAISLGANAILHANAKSRCVRVETLGPGSGSYGEWLAEQLAGVRRLSTCS